MTHLRPLLAFPALLLTLVPAALADENALLSIPKLIASAPPQEEPPETEQPPELVAAQPVSQPELIAPPKEAAPDKAIRAEPAPVETPPGASPRDEPAADALLRDLKPVLALRVNIQAPEGKLPTDYAAQHRHESPTPAGQVLLRTWPTMAYHWKAPGSRHYPLYFEEINAERYGYTHSRCLQPAISAAHFFGTIPALPYLMAADCPRECVYTLGHYRPGNCNPWRTHCWPCSLSGTALEGAAVYGLIALIP